MNTSNIKSFSVSGLFGTDDIHIPFDENIKILVGENGIGKTQVLNLFYYTLTRNFFKLGEFKFDRLVLSFNDRKSIEITKFYVDELVKEIYDNPIIMDEVNHQITHPSRYQDLFFKTEILKNKFIQSRIDLVYTSDDYKTIYEPRKRGTFVIQIGRKRVDIFNPFFSQCEKEIESGIGNTEIMYFPTYRRVEEDLHNLGYNDDEILNQENTLIQFGMDDVQKRFTQIESKIDKLLKEGFSKITSEILSQLIKGFSHTDNNFLSKINENDIEIILARVGKELSENDKNEIRNSVKNQSFENPSLTYILKKLVEIYDKQKELDDSVKKFKDVCNKYLINKRVFYDESAIKIFIKSKKTDAEIDLSKLSSGEKQIISTFSKIYLSESNKRFIILFDEPELSLSMIWQRQLLPDIINSGKCELLLAVTHSPFIFDNELDKYAIGFDQYIQPSEMIIA
ncbi:MULTISPECIES: AAA family ATPase [Nostocales]|uniref:AAA family ATPase n=1 Tax=Nostocales TaxID=1161 RepID=UPI0011D27DB3|nr:MULTISPECIES: AAA family ATPase [Nostocales]MBO1051054.1 AAA family ATPase [Dolichospermum sp. DET73]MTJ19701.1 AAA family ATPase [Dolichospermum sp. UHCC 0299]MTJ22804.1 AAA family ATPase [Dolichospermum sp. UHCC 0352]MTJ39681.1 AAA family ATPase [Dolichospermum sp. UHCC 0406]